MPVCYHIEMINDMRRTWLTIVGPVALSLLWLWSLALPGAFIFLFCLAWFIYYAHTTPNRLASYLVGVITGELIIVGLLVLFLL